MHARDDAWVAGKAYEPYIGRWSRLVASAFVDWLGAPADGRWIDVGCGTGAMTATILSAAAPSRVSSIDRSAAYAAFARDQIADRRAAFTVADAQELPFENEKADLVVSGLVLNFVPRPELAVAEMVRVVRPGGIVAVYLWDYAGEMQLIRYFWDAAIALDRRAVALDEARRFPLCQPRPLEALFAGAGLEQVESRAVDVPTHFRDFSDFWTPFLGGQGPAPGYLTSLGEDEQVQLRERLRARLPVSESGSIELVARAWAIRGRRKGMP